MTENFSKISIVTPSYNQSKFIREAIENVKNQGYPNFEHIIIDNCSDDGTTRVLREYPHLHWVSEPDQGQSDALNKGFLKATGDIIGWLNADDSYAPGCFMKVAGFFNHHKGNDIVYGDYRLVDEKGTPVQLRRELDFDLFMLKYLHVLYVPSTTTFFKRKIFDEGNFLDTSYHYSMDYEFFLRLALKGYKFSHINDFLADFRWHAESKSVSAVDKQREETAKALFAHDKFLKFFVPPVRHVLKAALTGLARAKRYFLKGIKGFYLQQWIKHV